MFCYERYCSVTESSVSLSSRFQAPEPSLVGFYARAVQRFRANCVVLNKTCCGCLRAVVSLHAQLFIVLIN